MTDQNTDRLLRLITADPDPLTIILLDYLCDLPTLVDVTRAVARGTIDDTLGEIAEAGGRDVAQLFGEVVDGWRAAVDEVPIEEAAAIVPGPSLLGSLLVSFLSGVISPEAPDDLAELVVHLLAEAIANRDLEHVLDVFGATPDEIAAAADVRQRRG